MKNGIDRDTMNRGFFRVMLVRSHAEGAAGNQDHTRMLGTFARPGANDPLLS